MAGKLRLHVAPGASVRPVQIGAYKAPICTEPAATADAFTKRRASYWLSLFESDVVGGFPMAAS